MESLARDIAVLAGLTGCLYALTVENLKPYIADRLIAEPTSTVDDLTAWFLANIGAGSAVLSEEYEGTVQDLVTAALP
jgi:hypothetical protein